MATVPNLPFSGAQLHSLLLQFADEIAGASGPVTWANLSGKPTSFPPAPHRHDASEIDNLPTGGVSTAWADLTGVPSSFPPAAHTHAWTEVTGKPTTFTPAPHTHDIADVTGLQAALDAKTARIFDTDAEAEAYAAANPGAVVFSREGV